MSNALATLLHDTGKAHAEASCLLYRASLEQAERDEIEDRVTYAFNGPFSLSTQYLLGLGIELMLKSAIVAWDPKVDAEYLRKEISHDLVTALDEAERRGLKSEAPHLREIVEILRDPYKKHWLRYEHPPTFNLPADFDQIVATLTVLESELANKLGITKDGASWK